MIGLLRYQLKGASDIDPYQTNDETILSDLRERGHANSDGIDLL